MFPYLRPILICALSFCLLIGAVSCVFAYQTGFRTIGSWKEEREERLDLNVWYPTTRKEKDISFSPWTFSASLNARCAEGEFPLLILSHPSHASRFFFHELASFFAQRGFIVVAPTHIRDSIHNMDDLFTWKQMERRAREIRAAIEVVLEQDTLAPHIDKEQIGLVGFGAGGTTALLMGGAIPSCSSWPYYQTNAGIYDAYTSQWAKDKINSLCANLPNEKKLTDNSIKVMAAISPAYGMFFDEHSFKNFSRPFLLIGIGKDIFNKIDLHSRKIARLLGKKAHYTEIAEADMGSLTSRCPQIYEEELPEMCLSVSLGQRREIQLRLANTLYTFFSHYLHPRAVLTETED